MSKIIDVPNHLLVGARTGFLASAAKMEGMPYRLISEIVPMTSASMTMVDIGDAPMPSKSTGRSIVKAMIERSITVAPESWDIVVGISYNDLKDDQTGKLDRKVRSAGENFQRHINNRVFQVLNGGDTSTYGLCYDGQEFFDSDHVDKGAEYQTAQDNEYGLALSLDNFNTVRTAARKFRNEFGEYLNYNFDQLIVSPDLEYTASQLVSNPQAYDTANREINPFAGKLKPAIVSPELDSTAWILTASSETAKPIIVVMREEPNLQEAWFDPNTDDGGSYFFKFYSRYEVYYGLWQLAVMGNS